MVHAWNPSTQEEGRWIAPASVRLRSAAKMPQDSAGPVPQKAGTQLGISYNVGEGRGRFHEQVALPQPLGDVLPGGL